MKCSKYFGAKWRGFIKSKSILVPKGASRFKTQNIRYDTFINLISQVFIGIVIVPINIFNFFPLVCGEGKEKKDFTKKQKQKRFAESEHEDVDELRLLKMQFFIS